MDFAGFLRASERHIQEVAALGQFIAALIAGLVAIYVYIYTRRRDKLEFFYTIWNKQQDVNLQCLVNEEALRAREGLVSSLW